MAPARPVLSATCIIPTTILAWFLSAHQIRTLTVLKENVFAQLLLLSGMEPIAWIALSLDIGTTQTLNVNLASSTNITMSILRLAFSALQKPLFFKMASVLLAQPVLSTTPITISVWDSVKPNKSSIQLPASASAQAQPLTSTVVTASTVMNPNTTIRSQTTAHTAKQA